MTEAGELRGALHEARELTLRLLGELDDDVLRAQFDPDFSPLGWHFGHIVWQEECWVLRRVAGEPPIVAELDAVFDSFDARKDARGARLPERAWLESYAARVRERTLAVLERADFAEGSPLLARGHVFRFLANHERQHAEIMAAVRLLGGLRLHEQSGTPRSPFETPRGAAGFVRVPSAEAWLGSHDDPDGWDNERPAQRVVVPEFELGRHPVSAGEFLEFVDAGGYDDDRLWSDEGAHWRRTRNVRAPLHWRRASDGSVVRRTLVGEVPLDPLRPVAHVSYYEAEAFARFAGARLPWEVEWEHAASWDPVGRHKRRFAWGDEPGHPPPANVGLRWLDVTPRGALPEGAAASGAHDMLGNVWEWTASRFEPYPDFSPQPYAGYSAPWFDGRHRVARGGSYMTQIEIARCCFRNWYEPHIRALPLGLRLAR